MNAGQRLCLWNYYKMTWICIGVFSGYDLIIPGWYSTNYMPLCPQNLAPWNKCLRFERYSQVIYSSKIQTGWFQDLLVRWLWINYVLRIITKTSCVGIYKYPVSFIYACINQHMCNISLLLSGSYLLFPMSMKSIYFPYYEDQDQEQRAWKISR